VLDRGNDCGERRCAERRCNQQQAALMAVAVSSFPAEISQHVDLRCLALEVLMLSARPL
jgi:hypothetical protein